MRRLHRLGWLLAWYLTNFLMAIFIGYPLFWLVTGVFKTNREIFLHPWALPSSLNLSNIHKILSRGAVETFYMNSIIITSVSVLLIVAVSSLAAYILARGRFRGKRLLFWGFIAGMMIPPHVTLIPLYIMFSRLGLLNTLTSLVLVYTAFAIPISVFILKGFFEEIPVEIEEAATVDGCSPLRLYWSIMMPLIRPAIATVVIYNGVVIWNEFTFAITFIREQAKQPIPAGVYAFSTEYGFDISLVLTVLTLTALPLLVLYFIFQKRMIKGMSAGALKG